MFSLIRWVIDIKFGTKNEQGLKLIFEGKKERLSMVLDAKYKSNDFSAQITDATMAMIRYMVALKFLFVNYDSKGAIF